MRLSVMSTIAVLAAISCGGDDVVEGLRSECQTFGGAGLECESPPIESVADLCAKLLDCGVMPLENPDGGFDWEDCMQLGGDLDDLNRATVFACVEVASCDELQFENGPPLCLQHGN